MNPKLLIRLAMACVLFFALGHSVGHLTRRQIADPAGQAVLRQMESYRFPVGTQFRTYDEFYTGMSLNLIVSLLCLAGLLALAASLADRDPVVCRKLLWPVLLGLALYAATSFLYFFVVPGITCALAVGCLGWALRKLGKAGPHRAGVRSQTLNVS